MCISDLPLIRLHLKGQLHTHLNTQYHTHTQTSTSCNTPTETQSLGLLEAMWFCRKSHLGESKPEKHKQWASFKKAPFYNV